MKFSSLELLESLNLNNQLGYCYHEDCLSFLDDNEKQVISRVLASVTNDKMMDRKIYVYENEEEKKLTEDINLVKDRFIFVLKSFHSLDNYRQYHLPEFVEFLMYGYNLDMLYYLFNNFRLAQDKVHLIIDYISRRSNMCDSCNAFDYKDFKESTLVNEVLSDTYSMASTNVITNFFNDAMSKIITNNSYVPFQSIAALEMIDNSGARKYIQELLKSLHKKIENNKACFDIIRAILQVAESIDEEYVIKIISSLSCFPKKISSIPPNKTFFITEALLNPYTYTEEGIIKFNLNLEKSHFQDNSESLCLTPIYENSSTESFYTYLKIIDGFPAGFSEFPHTLDIDKTDKTTLYSKAKDCERYKLLNMISDMDDFIRYYKIYCNYMKDIDIIVTYLNRDLKVVEKSNSDNISNSKSNNNKGIRRLFKNK